MIDYEALSLIGDHTDLVQNYFMNYVTVFFALIVTAYFVAEKLPALFVLLVLLIFTGFVIVNVNIMALSLYKMQSLREIVGSNVPEDYWKPGPLGALNWVAFWFVYIGSYVTGVGFTLYVKFKKTPD